MGMSRTIAALRKLSTEELIRAQDAAAQNTVVSEGRVKSMYMEDMTGDNLKAAMKDYIVPTAQIMTDESKSYGFAGETFAGHESVRHSRGEYVRGGDSINTAESVHALLKRGIVGMYHHVSKLQLHHYLSEFDFRFNMPKAQDGDRTLESLKGFEGNRLMYRVSTKKD